MMATAPPPPWRTPSQLWQVPPPTGTVFWPTEATIVDPPAKRQRVHDGAGKWKMVFTLVSEAVRTGDRDAATRFASEFYCGPL